MHQPLLFPLHHSAPDSQPQEGHQLAWLAPRVLLLAGRGQRGLIRFPPMLHTEEGGVPGKKILGLLLKGGTMGSGQRNSANVHPEAPREDQAMWFPEPDYLELSFPFFCSGWTQVIIPILGQSSAITQAGFR